MLKAELHIHTKEDPLDWISIGYSARQLIDQAAKQNFDVLAFTCHNKVIHSPELEDYAQSKNILLIPGVERTIRGKHVLIYNLTEEESQNISSFQDLKILKQRKQQQRQPFLIIAPHPFYPVLSCLRSKALDYLDLFDAWEYSFFYTRWINPNKKTLRLAERYQKPVVGNSDVHQIGILGKTCSFINSEKNLHSVFQAVKDNRITVKTQPLSFFCLLKLSVLKYVYGVKRLVKQQTL